ncbi:hypothetical protein PybrP1_013188 [[Pythium] brassicae (nom. inval.)]|nr:hypothetical protein PybrP1_013188 [[Pythium] brassicae (nom. inval.)]
MRPSRSVSAFAAPPAFHIPTIPVGPGKPRGMTLPALLDAADEEPVVRAESPLAVQVLRVHKEEKKESAALKKEYFVYEIEACHQFTGDVFRAERRFREFKQLREALLHEGRECAACRPLYEKLREAKLPSRKLVVLDQHKYAAQRVLVLSHFLRDLVALVAAHAQQCGRHGCDIDKSVGLFLGLQSLSDADALASSASKELLTPLKTRQERIDFRASSLPDFRLSSSSLVVSDEVRALHRRRGLSEC